MFKYIIEWFSRKHLLVNIIALTIIVSGIISWNNTKKEEMPDVTFPFSRVIVNWPGASPEDMDRYVTVPIEKALRSINGIEELYSTTTQGSSILAIYLPIKASKDDMVDIVQDIEDALDRVDLPDDIKDDPEVRVPETSRFSVINLSIYKEGARLFSEDDRKTIQKYAKNLENILLSLSSVSEVRWRNYVNPQVNIYLNVDALRLYGVSISEAISAIQNGSLRSPVGTMKAEWDRDEEVVKAEETVKADRSMTIEKSSSGKLDKKDYKIIIDAELTAVPELENLIIRMNFEGNAVYLKDIARVVPEFEDADSIFKTNGYEAITMTVTKSSSIGIIDAVEDIKKKVFEFEKNSLAGSEVKVVLVDDESVAVKDRLSLVTNNGILGFSLILIVLFIFLNAKAGVWVAFGLPFSLCFTLIGMNLMGYSINNTTLAAVIIVLGMVVDDAIVVAENINRLEAKGMARKLAVVEGTGKVFLPIVASIVTTCIAFVPLFFFGGRFGLLNAFIPPVIFIMLFASLFESVFILPAHMSSSLFDNKKSSAEKKWFVKLEIGYQRLLEFFLHHRKVVFLVALLLLGFAGFVFHTGMKFEMFPREESTRLRMEGEVAYGSLKRETARRTEEVEAIINEYMGKEVLSYETRIAQTRRSSAARENVFSLVIELVPLEKRDRKSSVIQKEIEQKISALKNFDKLEFSRGRFGSTSGNAIEIQVKDNNDETRKKLTEVLLNSMKEYPAYINVDQEKQLQDPEYVFKPKRSIAGSLNVSISRIVSALRTAINGTILYEVPVDNDDVQYRLTVEDKDRKNVDALMSLPVLNNSNYSIPLGNVVDIFKGNTPNSINRVDSVRTTKVFADINDESVLTPVETAVHFEQNVFPDILSQFPTSSLVYAGEVKDTRESTSEFLYAIIAVLFLIYIILALLFNSLIKPFLIMITIPFAAVGIIFALKLHGMSVYGFFSVIGCLGLMGVVVNDSIVMISVLEDQYTTHPDINEAIRSVASIAKTRLRAVILTTVTTVVGLMPTAYGILGYDSMLSDMMLVMAWGLIFGTLITLVFVPILYLIFYRIEHHVNRSQKISDK
ncbi:MAG: efflux RND transporter permease subunit [Spirochaetes bacterium]|jgi:multidrug efflux pump subunit AcrB|nr:efflux RND transporter permease subunit [Spirochaetota bacterium]